MLWLFGGIYTLLELILLLLIFIVKESSIPVDIFQDFISLSLLSFPLSIPMACIKNETAHLIVVVLGILSFIGEIGIGLFKKFKL